jgi:1-phosphatidylinositol phosphodiesterase
MQQSSPIEAISSPRVAAADSIFYINRNNLFGTAQGTSIPPAVTNYNNDLVVLYANKSNNELRYATGNNDKFSAPLPFITRKTYTVTSSDYQAVASYYGKLHAIIRQGNDLHHFIFNDADQVWDFQVLVALSARLPTLTEYNGELFLAMLTSGNRISFSTYSANTNSWSSSKSVNGESSWGITAMFVENSTLSIAFPENNTGRAIIYLSYDPKLKTWSRTGKADQSTAFGVSAAFTNNKAFMTFQRNSDGTGLMYLNVFDGGRWIQPHEEVPGQSSDTPMIAALDDMLNIVYNSHDDNRDVLWIQRRLTNYSLESWMSVDSLPDSKSISALSIPGSHDSAAISYLPYVSCQTMSITNQLNSGIRFLDLRCGLRDNTLYMFHGDIALNYPYCITLESILREIQDWLSLANHRREAILVQIKEETNPSNSTVSFATVVHDLIKKNPIAWNTGSSIPTLGALRGKMQLVRRYSVNSDAKAGEQEIGIDLSKWPPNDPNFTLPLPSGTKIIGQDKYAFPGNLETIIREKFSVFDKMLTDAAFDTNLSTWYINYSSASAASFPFPSYLSPYKVSAGGWNSPMGFTWLPGVNTSVRNKLYDPPGNGKRYGTIVMDFPESESDLIARIVALNMP